MTQSVHDLLPIINECAFVLGLSTGLVIAILVYIARK